MTREVPVEDESTIRSIVRAHPTSGLIQVLCGLRTELRPNGDKIILFAATIDGEIVRAICPYRLAFELASNEINQRIPPSESLP